MFKTVSTTFTCHCRYCGKVKKVTAKGVFSPLAESWGLFTLWLHCIIHHLDMMTVKQFVKGLRYPFLFVLTVVFMAVYLASFVLYPIYFLLRCWFEQ